MTNYDNRIVLVDAKDEYNEGFEFCKDPEDNDEYIVEYHDSGCGYNFYTVKEFDEFYDQMNKKCSIHYPKKLDYNKCVQYNFEIGECDGEKVIRVKDIDKDKATVLILTESSVPKDLEDMSTFLNKLFWSLR